VEFNITFVGIIMPKQNVIAIIVFVFGFSS
jgi:hypothetical protein